MFLFGVFALFVLSGKSILESNNANAAKTKIKLLYSTIHLFFMIFLKRFKRNIWVRNHWDVKSWQSQNIPMLFCNLGKSSLTLKLRVSMLPREPDMFRWCQWKLQNCSRDALTGSQRPQQSFSNEWNGACRFTAENWMKKYSVKS